MPVEKKLFDSREEWLAARKNHIGGSDAACCIGRNPYKDNVTLWEEKMGLVIPTDISDRSFVRYGIQAEGCLRALFALDHPEYQVDHDENNMFSNTDHPWMHASLDGELTDGSGRHGILEIKTTQLQRDSQWEKWNGQIPDHYYCQVLHYLAVTGYDFAVLRAQIKCSWDRNRIEIRDYYMEREEVGEEIRYLVEEERRFWRSVESGTRPYLILPPIEKTGGDHGVKNL